MTARLGMTCACLQTVSVECPSLDSAVLDDVAFAGWGYDERGFVRCPDCLAGGVVASRAVPVAHPDLFSEAA